MTTLDTATLMAYLDGRQVRWQVTLDECINEAGEEPGARLLAVFDALQQWASDPSRFRGCFFSYATAELAGKEHPLRLMIGSSKQTLREKVLGLAKATDALEPEELVDQLLLIYEGAIAAHALGHVHGAAGTAHMTARQLIAAATAPRHVGV